jgi:uncharacterized repeat protein (TIGR03803 family)
VQGRDGSFYGTTVDGGENNTGTVFQIKDGTLTTLASLTGSNGRFPMAELVQGKNGKFYGTTANGGDNDYGTVFQVTHKGVLTTLYSFNNSNGAYPLSGLTLGSDGDLYGTTHEGGAFGGGPWGYGTVFRIAMKGKAISHDP